MGCDYYMLPHLHCCVEGFH